MVTSGNQFVPVRASERYVILDALRGFALLGICMANFPEFSLFTFLKPEVVAEMPTAEVDKVVRFLMYMFVDGKFYTLFSLLFGIGFSIIIRHVAQRGGNGLHVFYRRMLLLLVIGFLHLMFIWSGDILMLYALMGMLLPLFRNLSGKRLIPWAMALLFFPIVVDALCELTGTSLSLPAVRMQQFYCAKYGIMEDNFAYWLRDAEDYGGVFQFLVQGACVRLQEFVDGNRYFKVLGLFLIGFYIGRERMYANLGAWKCQLEKIFRYGLLIGLPSACLYACSAMHHQLWGLTSHSVLYFLNVYALGFAYAAGICLLYLRGKDWGIWHYLAAPGRMALTNYIGQSVIGMFLFYGIGCGLGAGMGLVHTECIVLGVYLFQVLFSCLWLSVFRFGPLEWIWRMLTYGKWFPLCKR